MVTIGDLLKMYGEIDVGISLFGANDDGMRQFNTLADAARDAIMEENGCKSPEEVRRLPRETPLGEKALAAMKALEAFNNDDLESIRSRPAKS